jgi:spermidine/putrescine transport system permease protein
MESRSRVAVLMTPPALFLVALFLLPLAVMVLFTFRAGSFGPDSEIFTLQNYRDFLGNTALHRLLWRSTVIAFLVSLYSIVLAYPIAYFLVFEAGRTRLTLLTIIIVPAWVSYLLRVLAWKVILGSNGMLSSFLQWVGLANEAVPVLLYSRSAVVITLVYVWIPFVALPIFAALERVDRGLLEAAADLGSTNWQAFLRITLPLSLPGVIAGFLFVFIPTVGEYVTPALVGGTQGLMYGNLIWSQFLAALNWPMGSLMSLAMLLVVLVPIFLFGRFVRLSELAGL